MTVHALHAFFDPPGHGPDWLLPLMAFLAFMAVWSFISQHGRGRS